jgi:small nuclear ribonucleoprotein F
MNVLLHNTEEYLDGKPTGALGVVLIRYVMRPRATCQACENANFFANRCNNILYIGSADSVEITDMQLK